MGLTIFDHDPSKIEEIRLQHTFDAPVAMRVDDSDDPNVIYVGYAKRGSLTSENAWQIKKIFIDTGTNNEKVIVWAYHIARKSFLVPWDNHATNPDIVYI